MTVPVSKDTNAVFDAIRFRSSSLIDWNKYTFFNVATISPIWSCDTLFWNFSESSLESLSGIIGCREGSFLTKVFDLVLAIFLFLMAAAAVELGFSSSTVLEC